MSLEHDDDDGGVRGSPLDGDSHRGSCDSIFVAAVRVHGLLRIHAASSRTHRRLIFGGGLLFLRWKIYSHSSAPAVDRVPLPRSLFLRPLHLLLHHNLRLRAADAARAPKGYARHGQRIRHRVGELLCGGLGLTAELGWINSENDEAQSPRTAASVRRGSSSARPPPRARAPSRRARPCAATRSAAPARTRARPARRTRRSPPRAASRSRAPFRPPRSASPRASAAWRVCPSSTRPRHPSRPRVPRPCAARPHLCPRRGTRRRAHARARGAAPRCARRWRARARGVTRPPQARAPRAFGPRAPRVRHARAARGVPVGQLVLIFTRVRFNRGRVRARAHAGRDRAAADGERARAAAERVKRVAAQRASHGEPVRVLERAQLTRARTRSLPRPRPRRARPAGIAPSSTRVCPPCRARSRCRPARSACPRSTALLPTPPPPRPPAHRACAGTAARPSRSPSPRRRRENARRAQAAAAQALIGAGLAPRPRTRTGIVYRRTSAVYAPLPSGVAPEERERAPPGGRAAVASV
jgi:hypothetical protein